MAYAGAAVCPAAVPLVAAYMHDILDAASVAKGEGG